MLLALLSDMKLLLDHVNSCKKSPRIHLFSFLHSQLRLYRIQWFTYCMVHFITASRTIIHYVTCYVVHRTFNANLWYSCVSLAPKCTEKI